MSPRRLPPDDVLPGRDCRVQGLVKIEGEIVLIYDLEKLFSQEDQERILQVKAAAEA
jgi:chemotaxis signal transduction protein